MMRPRAFFAAADDQITTYTFANDYNPSAPTQIQYPDGDATNDNVKLTYNLDGSVAIRESQKDGDNRTKIEFDYDVTFHRLTGRKVTLFGDPVDQTVKAIGMSYDNLSRVLTVTSYSDTGYTTVVNQIQYAYGDLSALEKEYQEHDGAVDGSTPYVQYNYMDSALAGVYTKGMRLKNVVYPSTDGSGRLVHYRYGDEGSTSEMLSRLATIHADGTGEAAGLPGQTLAAYAYNGLGRIATETFKHNGNTVVELDYAGDSSGAYSGFDRFGRVKDQRWHASGTDKDRYTYGYDYASNRLWRQNGLTHGTANKFDWAYSYDGLHRLADAARGTLDDPPSEGLISKSRAQQWGLDPVGNWGTFKEGDGASWSLEQERDNNKANEIIDITETTGSAWVTPTWDARGNMDYGPRPGDEATATEALLVVYDAWNRPVEFWEDTTEDGDLDDPGDTQLLECRYDGTGRRIKKTVKGDPDVTFDYYYNSAGQVLEVRKGGSANPYKQYVWGAWYVHSPVCRWYDENTDGEGVVLHYYLNDANFNVTALVGTDGTVVERVTYDPYGKATFRAGDWTTPSSTSSYANVLTYTGHRLDTETGLYHTLYRPYHPTLGCWLTRDLDYYDGMSLYLYVRSSPASATDPLGDYYNIAPATSAFARRWFRDAQGAGVPLVLTPPAPAPTPPPAPTPRDPSDEPYAERKTEIYRIRGYAKDVELGMYIPIPTPTIINLALAILGRSGYSHPSPVPGIDVNWEWMEIGHTVLSYGRGGESGADFAPPPKDGGGRLVLKKFWPVTGASRAPALVLKLDAARGWISGPSQLRIKGTLEEHLKHPDTPKVVCLCATEEQVRACLKDESKEWDGTTFSPLFRDCNTFAEEAMEACCLEKFD